MWEWGWRVFALCMRNIGVLSLSLFLSFPFHYCLALESFWERAQGRWEGGEGRTYHECYHNRCNRVQLSVFVYWLSVSMSKVCRCVKFESCHVWVMEGRGLKYQILVSTHTHSHSALDFPFWCWRSRVYTCTHTHTYCMAITLFDITS